MPLDIRGRNYYTEKCNYQHLYIVLKIEFYLFFLHSKHEATIAPLRVKRLSKIPCKWFGN